MFLCNLQLLSQSCTGQWQRLQVNHRWQFSYNKSNSIADYFFNLRGYFVLTPLMSKKYFHASIVCREFMVFLIMVWVVIEAVRLLVKLWLWFKNYGIEWSQDFTVKSLKYRLGGTQCQNLQTFGEIHCPEKSSYWYLRFVYWFAIDILISTITGFTPLYVKWDIHMTVILQINAI